MWRKWGTEERRWMQLSNNISFRLLYASNGRDVWHIIILWIHIRPPTSSILKQPNKQKLFWPDKWLFSVNSWKVFTATTTAFVFAKVICSEISEDSNHLKWRHIFSEFDRLEQKPAATLSCLTQRRTAVKWSESESAWYHVTSVCSQKTQTGQFSFKADGLLFICRWQRYDISLHRFQQAIKVMVRAAVPL